MNRAAIEIGACLPLVLVFALAGCGADEPEPADDLDTVELASPDAGVIPPPVSAAGGEMLDPGTATREQLLEIPGMDAPAADALLAGRPYATMGEVDRVLSATLDEAQREAVYATLWKPIDLNSATGEEIQLIPGVGDRMQHEFEEYRPYRGIEEFRREIGKYVDDEEVARLERYVMIP